MRRLSPRDAHQLGDRDGVRHRRLHRRDDGHGRRGAHDAHPADLLRDQPDHRRVLRPRRRDGHEAGRRRGPHPAGDRAMGAREVALHRFDPHGLRRRLHPPRDREQRDGRGRDEGLPRGHAGTRSRGAAARAGRRTTLQPGQTVDVRIPPTIAVGAVGGLLVGLTSVGSGSIVIVCLMLLYPALRAGQLVGTDLVQAIPLVTSAAIAHIIVGDFELALTASILIGAVPAVYLGARLSSKAPDWLIRPALVFVLTASALKLLDVPTVQLGIMLLAGMLVGLPVWGALDAASYPEATWQR